MLEARLSIELGVLDIIIDKITPQQLDELRALADCARYDDTPEEIERNYHRDCEFHRKLLEISENQVLIAFSNLLEIFFTRRSASAEASQAGRANTSRSSRRSKPATSNWRAGSCAAICANTRKEANSPCIPFGRV